MISSIKRRHFLRGAALGSAAMFLQSCTFPMQITKRRAHFPGSRPNILLSIADDMTFHDCGCYGSTIVNTPNIDRLAAEGMKFNYMFTATAMCAPTRQQLYTGIFPVRNGAYPNHSSVYDGTKSIVHYLKDSGYRAGLAGKSHCKPPESFPWEVVSEKGKIDYDRIEEFITRDTSQPYCLIFASTEPHAPWSKGDATAYPADTITVPSYLVDTPKTREGLSHYYAEITYLDGEIGKCMELVKKSGSEDNTIFIFTSEQGSSFPFGGKWTCYDNGLHTAFILRWPSQVKAGSQTDAMVQYVDVVPTLIEAAEDTVPEGLDGLSFMSVLEGKENTHREYVYGVHTTRGIINGSECYPIRSIRSSRYKYIWNLNHEVAFQNAATRERENKTSVFERWKKAGESDPAIAARARYYQHRPEVEFYDIVKDPYELNNLAADPQYRSVLKQMREKLLAWMEQQGDEGIATEMKAKERQGNRGRTDKKKQRD